MLENVLIKSVIGVRQPSGCLTPFLYLCYNTVKKGSGDIMMPSDPVMLLSFVNTKLRDEYSSLEALCDAVDVPQSEVIDKLKSIGYSYNKDQNQFK